MLPPGVFVAGVPGSTAQKLTPSASQSTDEPRPHVGWCELVPESTRYTTESPVVPVATGVKPVGVEVTATEVLATPMNNSPAWKPCIAKPISGADDVPALAFSWSIALTVGGPVNSMSTSVKSVAEAAESVTVTVVLPPIAPDAFQPSTPREPEA